MMRNRKGCAALLALLIIMNIALPVFSSGNTYTVSTRGDLEELAHRCSLDSWSRGKTVELLCDIDITGAALEIPSFSGVFRGNGYTISGVSIDRAGSYRGLFRYVKEGAVIEELHVKGSVAPQGTKKFAGGIAASNEGTIRSCSFEGSISADSSAGAIVGVNGEQGRIIACTSEGTVSAEQYAGGIAGRNKGFISGCENRCGINTVAEHKKQSVTDIDLDLGSAAEGLTERQPEDDKSDEKLLPGKSDMGGICGHSSGIIEGCRNYGTVGYEHVGYNVGGIAGRQSGFILGCENYGEIYGRKDIGGICGQLEPDVILSASGHDYTTIRDELNRLHSMADRLIDSAGESADVISAHLAAISEYAEEAGEHAQTLADSGADFVDNNIAEINAQAANIANAADKIPPALEKTKSLTERTGDALDEVSAAVDGLGEAELILPDFDSAIDELQKALGYTEDFSDDMSAAFRRLSDASELLSSAVRMQDIDKAERAIGNISAAAGDIAKIQNSRAAAVEKIRTILDNADGADGFFNGRKEMAEAVGEIAEGYLKSAQAMLNIQKQLNVLLSGVRVDLYDLRSGMGKLGSGMDDFSSAMKYISKAVKRLSYAVDDAYSALDEFSDEEVRDALKEVNNAVKGLDFIADDMAEVIGDLKEVVEELSENDSLDLKGLGEDFRTAGDGLFSAAGDISAELSAMRESFDGERDKLSGDLQKLTGQFNLVMNLLMNEIDDFRETVGDTAASELADYIVDVSDENINGIKNGKILDCRNFAEISADRNVGGIAGAMSIEYSKDPEDDIEKPNGLNFVYQTKAVVQKCVNDGKISAKKDAVGGICGYVSMGTVYECENYAAIESTAGDFAGGIAGRSDGSVRSCYSKSAVGARRCAGGIAGYAAALARCYAISSPEAEESAGSIAGDCSETAVRGCYFVDGGIGAVDGISYAGRAEPISYEELRGISGIPRRFISFTARFTADDETIEEQDIVYGAPTSAIRLPEIPEKEGYFGVWPEIEEDTVCGDIELEAEYRQLLTTIASKELSENGLALALAEGEFTDEAVLHITPGESLAPKTGGKVWDLNITDGGLNVDSVVPVRLLNADRKKASAWLLGENGWEKLDVKSRGRYIKINVVGADSTVCVVYEPRGYWWLLAVIIPAAAAAAAAVIVKKKKGKKKKQAVKN